jgi:hypothetical protein
MSTERLKILEMVAEGKITAEDAARLLEKLADSNQSSGFTGGGEGESIVHRTGKLKYLRVVVDSEDGDKVNIRVPLALVRTGIKLSTMVPEDANRKLAEKGVDLSALGGLAEEELIEALRELTVDVDSSDGDTVRIFCE